MSDLDQFMQQLSKEFNLEPPLSPEAPGIYLYPLENALTVEISTVQPVGIAFNCKLGSLHKKEKEEQLFEEMMVANLFGQGTRGATLGLDENESLTLSRTFDYQMDYQTFKDNLEDFVNVVDFWGS